MGCLFQGFRIYYGYGTSQVGFLLCTITDDNYLLKHLIVGLQLDGFNNGTVTNSYFTILVAYIAYRKDSVTGNLQLEVSVHISNGSALSVFDSDGSSCEGFTLFIDNLTANLDSRRLRHGSHNRCGIHHHATHSTQTKHYGK